MSFPDSYIFDLSKMRATDAVRQIGNAVPPNLAYDIARPLLDVLMEKFEDDQRRSEVVRIKEIHGPTNESHIPKTENITPSNVDPGHGEGSKADPITLN
jgi:hypothetical protein